MRPLRLLLEEFMGHRLTDINCSDFRSALVISRSRNDPRKSNGGGKSTIFLGIEYALFGNPLKHIDNLVRDTCDKCKVTFEFEQAGLRYRIVRSRNKKTSKSDVRLYQFLAEDWKDITQKTSTETEVEIAKIIKISHVAFKSSVLFAQQDLFGLMTASPAQRKTLLKEPLQIAVYTKYEKAAKTHAADVKSVLDRAVAAVDALGNPEQDIKIASEELVRLHAELELSTASIKVLETNLHEKRVALSGFEAVNSSDVDELNAALIKIRKNKVTIQETIANANRWLASNSIEKSQQHIATIESELVQFELEYTNVLKCVVRAESEVSADVTSFTNREVDGRAYIGKLESDKQRLTKLKITDDEICGGCRQVVTEEYRHDCETKRLKELEEVNEALVKYSKLLVSVRAKKTQFEAELKEISKKASDISSILMKVMMKKKDVEQAKHLHDMLLESIKSKKSDLEQSAAVLSDAVATEAKLIAEIASKNVDTVKTKINEISKEIRDLTNSIETSAAAITRINTSIGIKSETIRIREADIVKIAELQEKVDRAKEEYWVALKVSQAFCSSGIPTMIINTVLDDLQIVTNDLLNEIAPELQISFSVIKTNGEGQQEDTLDLTYRVYGCVREFEQISGGQKMMIALCLKMAMSKIIQHRMGVDIKFLELDEADAHLDCVARDAFAEVIKKWQDKYTIFVVTHDDYLKDKFSHAILVESDGVNGSCGKVVTSW